MFKNLEKITALTMAAGLLSGCSSAETQLPELKFGESTNFAIGYCDLNPDSWAVSRLDLGRAGLTNTVVIARPYSGEGRPVDMVGVTTRVLPDGGIEFVTSDNPTPEIINSNTPSVAGALVESDGGLVAYSIYDPFLGEGAGEVIEVRVDCQAGSITDYYTEAPLPTVEVSHINNSN